MCNSKENNTQVSNEETHRHGLYYVIPAAIMDREDINPITKLLYALLSGLADENGKCFPSDNYLSKRLHTAPRQIKYWLAQLEKLGLISRETHPCSSNSFKKIRTITVHSEFKNLNRDHVSNRTIDGAENRTLEVRKSALRVSEANIASEENNTPIPPKGAVEWVSFEPFVRLKKTDYEKFVVEKGKQAVDQVIEEINDYQLSTGAKYKDYAATIRNWFRRRLTKPNSYPSQNKVDKKQRDMNGNDLNEALDRVF